MPGGEAAPLRWRDVWLAIGWLLLAMVVIASLAPLADARAPFRHYDKLQHAAAYTLLMSWFGSIGARRRPAIAVGLLLLGIAVELGQGATGWRRADAWDVAADSVGILLGWVLALHHAPLAFRAVERLLGARR
jgi:VanZ family protein